MPSTLNQYTLGRTLGTGFSCKVKLAKDDSSTRYAIKIIDNTVALHNSVETEIQTLAALQHPNIVKLIECNTGELLHPKKPTKTVLFIVLELIGGGELFDLVALGGKLTEAQARYYFHQLLSGLDFMHQ